jgi:hypothetical protein
LTGFEKMLGYAVKLIVGLRDETANPTYPNIFSGARNENHH